MMVELIRECENPKVLVVEYPHEPNEDSHYLYLFEDILDAEEYESNYIYGYTKYYELKEVG